MERRVVITGLGAVTPIGNDVDTFWENLKAGKCGITKITKFDSTDFKAHVAAEVKDFDPLLYMDKGEVRKNDPFSQFAIAAATQAVNDSEIMGKIDPERFGVYFGSGIGGIQTFSNQVTALNEKGPRRVSAYFIPMLIANIAGGNIAIKFNAQGSCLPITTACATSNNEIGEAYRAIKHGYLDAIIAGGAEAAIVPVGVAGFGNMTPAPTRKTLAARLISAEAALSWARAARRSFSKNMSTQRRAARECTRRSWVTALRTTRTT